MSRIIKIDLSFGFSRSENYGEAVALAESWGEEYSCVGTGKAVRHHIKAEIQSDSLEALGQLNQLTRMVAGWRGTHINLVDPFHSNVYQIRDEVEAVQSCAERAQRYGPDAWCFGIEAPGDTPRTFGCRFLRGISRRSKDVQLFRYGEPGYSADRWPSWERFAAASSGGTALTVNRQEIIATLHRATDGHTCTACKYFSWERIEHAVDELPMTVDAARLERNEDRAQNEGVFGSFGDRNITKTSGDQRDVPKTTFADVGGQSLVVETMRKVVQLPLLHPEYFDAIGVSPHKGIILYGPPGNGKTLLCRALAGESKAHFELVNGPDVLSMFVGQSESNLREIFERAKQLAPSLVVIDELDSIAPARSDSLQQHDVRLVSQLLVLLDGMEHRGQVFVIGTTNRLDMVDPAIRRPGRFDFLLEVPSPDLAGRIAILAAHLAKMRVDRLQLDAIAARLNEWSGAEIAALCREGGLVAVERVVREQRDIADIRVTTQDFEAALERMSARRVQGR